MKNSTLTFSAPSIEDNSFLMPSRCALISPLLHSLNSDASEANEVLLMYSTIHFSLTRVIRQPFDRNSAWISRTSWRKLTYVSGGFVGSESSNSLLTSSNIFTSSDVIFALLFSLRLVSSIKHSTSKSASKCLNLMTRVKRSRYIAWYN